MDDDACFADASVTQGLVKEAGLKVSAFGFLDASVSQGLVKSESLMEAEVCIAEGNDYQICFADASAPQGLVNVANSTIIASYLIQCGHLGVWEGPGQ